MATPNYGYEKRQKELAKKKKKEEKLREKAEPQAQSEQRAAWPPETRKRTSPRWNAIHPRCPSTPTKNG